VSVLRCERNSPRSIERESQTREHHKVGVERDPLKQ